MLEQRAQIAKPQAAGPGALPLAAWRALPESLPHSPGPRMNVPLQPALPLPCTVVTDAAELERLREDWRAPLARSARHEGMLAPEWLPTLGRVFGHPGGRRPCAPLLHHETGPPRRLAPPLR